MVRTALILALLWAAPAVAETRTFTIDAELWSAPRTGAALVRMEPLREAVTELMRRPGGHIVVRYPGGEAGQLWAQELRAWLVALGVASSRIELLPGGVADDAVELQIVP